MDEINANIPANFTDLPDQKHYNLTHYHQRFHWDCGLSCILMILSSASRKQFLANFDQICEQEGFGHSTWTIDLCYILQKFNVQHLYLTKTIGVDPSYSQHSYYTKIIDKDEKRITAKFKDAQSHGVVVEQRTVPFKDIIRHLAHRGPVIILTNASLLRCDICKKDSFERMGHYAGHYVVLCGFDLTRKKVFYLNPEATDGHVCTSSIDSMDKARTAFGTDEDVILIFNR
ncbi:protein GUCD1 isoform X2 [Episyrphus balteatus]|uniref:protein GUCD1 isoform X2 n=1 Tax=Episyrphus balteatus TaxID=286459 RepID=UPI0024864EF7|nr:protein GUCD1 isoform X2 [Episyrphus balteatus]